ncbi:MAG: cobalt ECF transporter T component CbiQ [Methanospirillum sp.]|nr:cobalt ECF transporter T component CbiQ [Methanospirillum sp.]
MFVHDFLEEAAQKNALLMISPYTKLVLGLGSIILVLFSPNFIVPLILAGTMSFITIFYAKINPFFYLRLLSIPFGFALLSVLVIILLSGGNEVLWSYTLFSLLPLSVTMESLEKGMLVFFRVFGGMCALYFISLTTPMTDLFGVMRRVKIPDLFIDLSMIIYRFIFIFMGKAHQVHHAQQMRLGYSKPAEAIRSYSMLFGSIFITSWDAGEHYIRAMDCRCYNGRFAKLTTYNPVEWRTMTGVIVYLTGILILILITADIHP